MDIEDKDYKIYEIICGDGRDGFLIRTREEAEQLKAFLVAQNLFNEKQIRGERREVFKKAHHLLIKIIRETHPDIDEHLKST